MDLRKLNNISQDMTHDLPLLEDILDLMTRKKCGIMSVLDLRAAYHQIPISEESKYLTCFTTPHRGDFQYNRLVMGAKQSPCWMTVVLRKLFRNDINVFVLVYLDDILICSENVQEHFCHLRQVFDKFR